MSRCTEAVKPAALDPLPDVYMAMGEHFSTNLSNCDFRGTRVAKKEDVDVPTKFHAIGEDLFTAAHEQAGDGLLDVGIAVDRRGDAVGEACVEVWEAGDLFEFLDLFVCE